MRKITFYKYINNKKSTQKVFDSDYTIEVPDCIFLDDIDVVDPIIAIDELAQSILSPADYSIQQCNYAYVEDLNRYYFITGFTLSTKNILEISLHSDVLQNAYNSIKNNRLLVDRSTCKLDVGYNYMEDDNAPITGKTKRHREYFYTNPPYNTNKFVIGTSASGYDTSKFVLITTGDGHN